MAHSRRKHKKQFNTCEHRGYGKICHRCNPEPPADRTAALQGGYGPKVQKKHEVLVAAEAKRSRKKGGK